MKGVSIVICCFNSSLRLPAVLKHLAAQESKPGVNWELIVVNNASTDDTEAVAKREWSVLDRLDAELRVVHEEKVGLSHARAKGVYVARFDYVIFCDDDNWLNPNYVFRVPQLFEKLPRTGAIGGRGMVVADVELPAWFDEYQGYYAVGPQAERSGDISSKKYLWGAGMCFRKSLFMTAYKSMPPLLTDRKNDSLDSGGDSEFCMRLLLMGYNLYYDDELKFKHYMPAGRLTEAYRDKLIRGIHASVPVINLYSLMIDLKNRPLLKRYKLLFASIARYCMGKLKLVKRWDIGYQCRIIYFLTGLKFPDLDHKSVAIRELYLVLKNNALATS